MILTPELIKLRLKKLGVRTDKYLGQHFLVDESVLEAIMATAKEFVQPEDAIVEVGPGLGVLTEELVTLPNNILAVEKDPVFAERLPEFLNNPQNLTITQGDILKQLDASGFSQKFGSWMVVANIPYAITSPLLRKLVYSPNSPHHIVVLVQKEAAERICATPGNRERGLLTLQIEIMAETEIVSFVPPTAFWPAPEVESALLVLKKRSEPLIPQDIIQPVLHTVIAGFSSKRKQLINSLSGGLNLPVATVRHALEAAGINPTRRAETLSLAEWRALTLALKNSV